MASRILVVDDSVTIRKVVGTILERHGFDVLTAADGQIAFEALTGKPREVVDLVLLDFVMPRMNGYQFCRAVRQTPELATLPVVLMSAKSDKIRDQFVLQTGAIDAVTKPFDAQALVAVIENALRRVHSGQASSKRLPVLDDEEPAPDSDRTTSPGDERMRRARVSAEIAVNLARTIAPALGSLRPDQRGDTDAVTQVLAARFESDALRDFVLATRDLDIEDGPKIALSGDLSVIPIGAILQLLQVEGQSGVLTVSHRNSEITVAMRAGLIDLAQSRGTNDEFRLGRYFVEEGLVTPAELETMLGKELPANDAAPPTSGRFETVVAQSVASAAGARPEVPIDEERPIAERDMETMRLGPQEVEALVEAAAVRAAERGQARDTEPPSAPAEEDLTRIAPPSDASSPPAERTSPEGVPAVMPRLLGDRLLAAGRVSEEQLKTALVRQSSELVYEMLRWQKGRFEFKRKQPTTLASAARLGLTVPGVVMEGFRRVDEWRGLERTLGNFDEVLVRDALALEMMPDDKFAKPERIILDAIDGERTIREVMAASHMSSFDACRVLVQLLAARLVRRKS